MSGNAQHYGLIMAAGILALLALAVFVHDCLSGPHDHHVPAFRGRGFDPAFWQRAARALDRAGHDAGNPGRLGPALLVLQQGLKRSAVRRVQRVDPVVEYSLRNGRGWHQSPIHLPRLAPERPVHRRLMGRRPNESAGILRRAPGRGDGDDRAFRRIESFLFFVFWELMLVPIFSSSSLGGPGRVYAAVSFDLHPVGKRPDAGGHHRHIPPAAVDFKALAWQAAFSRAASLALRGLSGRLRDQRCPCSRAYLAPERSHEAPRRGA